MVSISTEDVGNAVKDWTKWGTAQSFNNVLLLSILVFMGVMSFYVVNYAIPAHLTMIQSGYEKIERHHESTTKQLIDAFKEDRERTGKTVEQLILRNGK